MPSGGAAVPVLRVEGGKVYVLSQGVLLSASVADAGGFGEPRVVLVGREPPR